MNERRSAVVLSTLAMTLALCVAADTPRPPTRLTIVPASVDRAAHAKNAKLAEVDARFAQAIVMLHAKRYDDAVAALHRLLELAPAMPEAHVNMGFALAGQGNMRAARAFFESAIVLRPAQANAYYGLALVEDSLGDRPRALGAMRSYVHLAGADDRYRTKALAAIWEWESEADRRQPQPSPVAHDK